MPAELHLAPQLQAERMRRRRGLWIAGICTVIALGLALASKPIYRAGKGWRARHLAADAEVLMTEEKWADALTKVKAAYQLEPDEPEAMRAVAHFQNATGNAAAALSFWKQLDELKVLSLTDRRRYAEDLFRSGMLLEAEQQIAPVSQAQPDDAAALRLVARMNAAKGSMEKSLQVAQQAARADPDNKDGRILVGVLQINSPDATEREKGWAALMQLAEDHGKAGLDALGFLTHRNDLPDEKARLLITLLAEHPLASEEQRLVGLDLEIKLQPDQRETFLESRMAKYKTAEATAKRSFGIWLNAHREFSRTLNLIPPAEASKRKDLLLVRLDALAGLNSWKEIQDILGKENVPLDAVYTELFLARSAMELGEANNAALHWRRAHLIAAPSPEQMWFLGTYAEKIGRIDEAELAYKSLTANASTARQAYEALLRLAQRKPSPSAARDLLREMRRRWSNDPAIENDYAYLSLLAGEEVADCLKSAQRLVTEAPRSLPHRTTLALAFFRLKRPAEALAVYDGLQISWVRVPPNQRAVYAAVLGLNGRLDEAKAEAKAIRLEDLRVEEQELIAPWRS
jgi:predicted Zn-dependent protease